MITAIGPVGHPSASAPSVSPVRLERPAAHSESAAAPTAVKSTASPLEAHLAREQGRVDGAGPSGPFRVSMPCIFLPGTGVSRGLDAAAAAPTDDVKYEVRMGGVLVAQVYQDGGAAVTDGFDLSTLSFGGSSLDD